MTPAPLSPSSGTSISWTLDGAEGLTVCTIEGCQVVSSETLPATAFQPSLFIVREGEGGVPTTALTLRHGIDQVVWKVCDGPDLQPACLKRDHMAEQISWYLPNAMKRYPIDLGPDHPPVSLAPIAHLLRYRLRREKGWDTHVFTLGGMVTWKIALPFCGRAGRDPRRPAVFVQLSLPRFHHYLDGEHLWQGRGVNTLLGHWTTRTRHTVQDVEILKAVHAWLLQLMPTVIEKMGVTRRRITESGQPKFRLALAKKPEVYVDFCLRAGKADTRRLVQQRVLAVQKVMGQGVLPEVTMYGTSPFSVAELPGSHRVKAYLKADGGVLRLEVTGDLDAKATMAVESGVMNYEPAFEYAELMGGHLLAVMGDAVSEPLTPGQKEAVDCALMFQASYDLLAIGVRLTTSDLGIPGIRVLDRAGLILPNPAPRTGYRLSLRATAYINTKEAVSASPPLQHHALRPLASVEVEPLVDGAHCDADGVRDGGGGEDGAQRGQVEDLPPLQLWDGGGPPDPEPEVLRGKVACNTNRPHVHSP